ncbi:hypothetical protein BAHKABFF_00013 [Salmonella phage CF-SP1]|nr:hypothetical protein BAHKABFF_00013 [Salmonella phage CF-SP1]
MSNMSYCQFRNTRHDFEQCRDAVGNAESIDDFSKAEQSAAEDLYYMAKDYIEWYEQLIQE